MPFAGLTKYFCIHLLHFVTFSANLINLDHTDQIIFRTADPIFPLCIKSMILGLVSFAKFEVCFDDYGVAVSKVCSLLTDPGFDSSYFYIFSCEPANLKIVWCQQTHNKGIQINGDEVGEISVAVLPEAKTGFNNGDLGPKE